MAEILLKNMEMPDCCNYCVGMVIYAKDTDGIWKDTCKLTGKPIDLDNRDGRPSDCPLVEVPPHGRLIDVDRFMDDNADGFEMNWDNEKGETIGRIFAPFAPVKKALDKAPTVIEASTKERE